MMGARRGALCFVRLLCGAAGLDSPNGIGPHQLHSEPMQNGLLQLSSGSPRTTQPARVYSRSRRPPSCEARRLTAFCTTRLCRSAGNASVLLPNYQRLLLPVNL